MITKVNFTIYFNELSIFLHASINPLTASTAPPPIEVTAQLVNVVNGHLSSGEFLKNDEITIPLPAPIGAPLPTSTPLAKPDLEATTY